MIVMKKWEPFSLKGMGRCLGEAGLAPRQTPGYPFTAMAEAIPAEIWDIPGLSLPS